VTTRVLIVDDNLSLAEDLAEILEDEGYVCNVCADPRQVARDSKNLEFDVALVDMRMPGLDGVALHRVLLEHHPSATYVLMTAYSSDDRVQQALTAGAKLVLPKPLPLPELLHALPPAKSEVLIVDDDRDLAEGLAEVLQHSGYRTHIAHNLAEARELVGPRLDAAIVDVSLPDGSGLNLAQELFERLSARVILISGYEPDPTVGSAGQRVKLLNKPFSPETLLEALGKITSAQP